MRPSRSARTCAAVVGLVCPKRLALGAATGTPAAAIKAMRHGMRGQPQSRPFHARRCTRRESARCAAAAWSAGRARRLRQAVRQPPATPEVSSRARCHVGHVNDHRVPVRTLLGGEDLLHRAGVQGVGSQSVDRLGGKRHQSAAAQNLSRLQQGRVARARAVGAMVQGEGAEFSSPPTAWAARCRSDSGTCRPCPCS